MGELSLSVESLFGLHSRIMQLTHPKTQLTASSVDFKNRLCYTMIRERRQMVVKLLFASNFTEKTR